MDLVKTSETSFSGLPAAEFLASNLLDSTEWRELALNKSQHFQNVQNSKTLFHDVLIHRNYSNN